MKIKKIQIKNNFKRFYDLTIDLGETPKKVVALIGPNGCGKSSVFDAMLNYSMHKTGRIVGHQRSILPDFLWQKVSPDNNAQKSVLINLDKEYTPKVQGEHNLFCFRSSYRYVDFIKVEATKSLAKIETNSEGANKSISIDDKMKVNYERLYSHFMELITGPDNLNGEEARARILGELNRSLEKCLGIKISDLGNIIKGRGTLYFTKSDQYGEFEFNVLSSGEKEVVDILMDIYVKKKVFNDSIYIIDEPELHINSSIQKQLLIEIDKMIPEDCQLWIATHSLGFMKALQEDFHEDSDIIYFNPENKYGSDAVVLKPIDKSRGDWKNIFGIALEEMVDLMSPKNIVYCEGRAEPDGNGDDQGIDADVYNKIFSKNYPETLFISAGGCADIPGKSVLALQIINKAFKGVIICNLVDRDVQRPKGSTKSGYMDEDEVSEFLLKSPNNRILNRKEIENYLYDWSVIKKRDPSCDKVKYDEIIGELNIVTGNVKNKATEKLKVLLGEASTDRRQWQVGLAEVITEDMDIYNELKECIFPLE